MKCFLLLIMLFYLVKMTERTHFSTISLSLFLYLSPACLYLSLPGHQGAADVYVDPEPAAGLRPVSGGSPWGVSGPLKGYGFIFSLITFLCIEALNDYILQWLMSEKVCPNFWYYLLILYIYIIYKSYIIFNMTNITSE